MLINPTLSSQKYPLPITSSFLSSSDASDSALNYITRAATKRIPQPAQLNRSDRSSTSSHSYSFNTKWMSLFGIIATLFATATGAAVPPRRHFLTTPTLLNPIANQTTPAGSFFSFTIDFDETFSYTSDTDFDFSKTDGTSLPSWLSVDPVFPPKLIGNLATEYARGFTIVGNYAYVADGNNDNSDGGLKIVDLTNPVSPTTTGSLVLPTCHDVILVENYAYLACGKEGLIIVNVNNPANPIFLESLVTYWTYRITGAGNYVYVADSFEGIKAFDVSNPANSSLAWSFDTYSANDITVIGIYAYVADGTRGLKIIKLNESDKPVLVGNLATTFAKAISVVGTFAFLADGEGGLKIIDVRNPTAPTLAGWIDLKNSASGVTVEGHYVYVTDDGGKVIVIDVSDPETPTLAGNIDTLQAQDITLIGRYAYVVDGQAGFKVFAFSKETLSGTPQLSDREQFPLRLTASDSLGQEAHTDFSITVPNKPPRVTSLISNAIATVGQEFGFAISRYTFEDEEDELVLKAGMTGNDPWPGWLSFDPSSLKFSGTPGIGDTDPLSDRTLYTRVTASDGVTDTATDFTISVRGKSYLERGLKIGSYLASTVTGLATLYALRGWIWEKTMKSTYLLPTEYVDLSKAEEYSHTFTRLQPDDIAVVEVLKNGHPLPGGALRPDWIKYKEITGRIVLDLSLVDEPEKLKDSTWTVRVKNRNGWIKGLVKEEFDIKFVDQSIEESKVVVSMKDDQGEFVELKERLLGEKDNSLNA